MGGLEGERSRAALRNQMNKAPGTTASLITCASYLLPNVLYWSGPKRANWTVCTLRDHRVCSELGCVDRAREMIEDDVEIRSHAK